MSTKGIEMPSGLELYPHNEKAYRKLLDMLSGTRRACIIHPTGTGKAFIAYRYAFDHPNERILWMSPSTYIEQEQEASIRRELPNHEFKNIERKREILIFMQIRLFSMSSIIRGHRSGPVVLKELSNAIPTPI